MPNLDPWINNRSSRNNIQNDNEDEYIKEKDLFEDNVDVFYNEDIDDDRDFKDDDDNESSENK